MGALSLAACENVVAQQMRRKLKINRWPRRNARLLAGIPTVLIEWKKGKVYSLVCLWD
jgi:hypothetical protein